MAKGSLLQEKKKKIESRIGIPHLYLSRSVKLGHMGKGDPIKKEKLNVHDRTPPFLLG